MSLEAIFLSTFVMIGQNRQAAFQQIVHLMEVFPVYERLDEALDRREASAC
ncbi:hypothetical protein A6P39_035840 [Streptomyces sp. FXJ1.172]|uniref:hypothetical protein n=1 Tax=Streptomyces sp. FXJ1.172 TaxID=710705 RepID=UPI0013315CEE|nr:hypothetical protein [Streptomyces sp. FXJ1.172]WEO98983.1 hypothetical protein A6P39_035840 [Streptomyces sp. FXJ1.172]